MNSPEPEKRIAPDLSSRGKSIALVLLVLACLHCTRAIFFQNVSWVDLKQYAAGQERSPFQERVAMMPILRIAAANPVVQQMAALLDREDRHLHGREALACAEVMSPEKLTSMVVATICNLLAVFLLFHYGKKFGALRWLPPLIFLAILYVSYAARYEEAFWYPYDLPHAFLFGVACVALLEGPLWLFFPLFLLDVPMRETSIFLVLVSFPFLLQRWGWKRAVMTSFALGMAWLAIRVPIAHHFAHNPSETGPRFLLNLKNLALLLHWPQMASLLGFTLLPIWLGRARLPRRYLIFLWTMLPCLCVTATFGIWIESRIAIEWSIPCAMLATIEFYHLLRHVALPETEPEPMAL